MPSFFVPGLPPTPPHITSGGRMESEHPFYMVGQPAFPPRYPQSGCDFIEQYSQSTGYTKPAPMNLHPQSTHPMHHGRDLASALGPQIPQPMFGPMPTANVLPPLRNNVQLPPMENAISQQYGRQDMMVPSDRPRKEEKPTGGVAAHLDYEMDQMSDFVAEMAQGIVCPGTSVPPQFRKYVYQILSSTRLPSSTILLGLFYLACRMRMLSSIKVYTAGSGQVYRMLTVALLLGSKFLDDNTFQNKSWAEVSNIPVAELNSMELEWLFVFEWKIHDRIYDKQDGFASWLSHWKTWRAKAAVRAQESRTVLAPIDTNVTRGSMLSSSRTNSNNNSTTSTTANNKPLMSPEGPIPPQYQRRTNFENSWLNPAASEYSPPSAPHSGPTTPDYYSAGPWAYANPPPPYSRAWMPPQQTYLPRSQPPSYHHTPSYALPFAQSVWTGHGSSCGCMYCSKHMEHYMFSNPFGAMQPILAG